MPHNWFSVHAGVNLMRNESAGYKNLWKVNKGEDMQISRVSFFFSAYSHLMPSACMTPDPAGKMNDNWNPNLNEDVLICLVAAFNHIEM